MLRVLRNEVSDLGEVFCGERWEREELEVGLARYVNERVGKYVLGFE